MIVIDIRGTYSADPSTIFQLAPYRFHARSDITPLFMVSRSHGEIWGGCFDISFTTFARAPTHPVQGRLYICIKRAIRKSQFGRLMLSLERFQAFGNIPLYILYTWLFPRRSLQYGRICVFDAPEQWEMYGCSRVANMACLATAIITTFLWRVISPSVNSHASLSVVNFDGKQKESQ